VIPVFIKPELQADSELANAFYTVVHTCTGCGKKSGPLKFFAIFSAIVWDFNMKFYSLI